MEKIFYEVLTVGGVLLISAETLRIYVTSRFDRIEGKLDMLRRSTFSDLEEEPQEVIESQPAGDWTTSK